VRRLALAILVLGACGDRSQPPPAPAPAPAPAATPIVVLDPGLAWVTEGSPRAQPAADEQAAIRVVMQWLNRVRDGVPAQDPVLALPLVSVVPPCEGAAPCARERIDTLMSLGPKLVPNIVASDLIAHFYHSRAFDTLGAATHVNVSVFGDLGRLGIERADITFAVMPDANGQLAIVGLEIATN
jgi:hypothetical protein